MFALGALLLFIGMLLILSTAILLPLYLKGALLFSAGTAGVILLPGSAMNALLSPIVGKWFDRIGARTLLPLGFCLTVISSVIFVMTISADASVWQIIVPCLLLFVGISMIIMPSQTNGLNQLPRELYADGSAVMSTLQQIAGATGTAFAVTFMVDGQHQFLDKFPAAAPEEILAGGTKYAFIFIAAFAAIGFVSSLFVKRVRV